MGPGYGRSTGLSRNPASHVSDAGQPARPACTADTVLKSPRKYLTRIALPTKDAPNNNCYGVRGLMV
jgi:hypothetical protein